MARRRKVKCPYGRLKRPKGKRICKRRPGRRGGRKARRGLRTKAQQEAYMWKMYKTGKLSGYGRRRRRR